MGANNCATLYCLSTMTNKHTFDTLPLVPSSAKEEHIFSNEGYFLNQCYYFRNVCSPKSTLSHISEPASKHCKQPDQYNNLETDYFRQQHKLIQNFCT